MPYHFMTNELKNKGFVTVTNEYAWKYKDATEVINTLRENEYVILGGDVLSKNFEYTYDNWFFENNNLSRDKTIIESAKKALQYIEWYNSRFGDGFYYIIVAEKV